MKEEFSAYLEELGMGNPFKERIDQLINNYSQLTDQPIDEIFVSEYRDNDGTKHYETLVLFTQSHVFETEHFLTEPRLWVAAYINKIAHVEITFSEYDFLNATAASRLSCVLRWDPGNFILRLKATGPNCNRLRDLVKIKSL